MPHTETSAVPTAAAKGSLIRPLRVFGFDAIEPVVLAALVSEDPILLIGKAGTGKTYLLNSISEAMRLEHRHYNASLISFDDLVGFPYPDADTTQVGNLVEAIVDLLQITLLIDFIGDVPLQGNEVEQLPFFIKNGVDFEPADKNLPVFLPFPSAALAQYPDTVEIPSVFFR